MSIREFLRKTILLSGNSGVNGAVFKRQFKDINPISEGASCISYEAYHEGSGRGVLKEFYPRDDCPLKRDARGQLVFPEGNAHARERYLAARRAFLEPYELLLKAKQGRDTQELSTFIPPFEIYRGLDSADEPSEFVYVWTPNPQLETFDAICDEIHRHPTENPEHKLVTVLTAIESLTKCLRALHSAALLHRDIKPSNFGFSRLGDETLTQTLTLFDIDTVCSVYADNEKGVGTPGYMEPESLRQPLQDPTCQTDIYSIGATLFTALIVTDETRAGGFLYRREYYDRLREMVDGSALIQASESNAHPRLRDALTVILEKTLAPRAFRYACCEDLLKDIASALFFAVPSGIVQSDAGERWVLKDLDASLDANAGSDSMLAIQYHLYEHPLYAGLSAPEDHINVLVVGCGNYGQKYLDACLQAGQIVGKTLNVAVVLDDDEYRAVYLAGRPELGEFFNIDGGLDGREDIYGNLRFLARRLTEDDPQANAPLICDVFSTVFDQRPPHHIFVALGNDRLNEDIAKQFVAATESLAPGCDVCYVSEALRPAADRVPGAAPLYVNGDVKASPLYPEIERMAFNTHLVWERSLNLDFNTVRANFRRKYNHSACVSNVLSIKSKLYSMGIPLEEGGFDAAAKAFSAKLSEKDDTLKNQLIWIEHRRWVTEKLCLGWRHIEDLEECAQGATKDEQRKRHVCIRRSRPDQKLAKEFKLNGSRAKWDSASELELNALDELDRMSVELHRLYVRKANEARLPNDLTENLLKGIRSMVEGDKQACVAFQEWNMCLKGISSGSAEKVRLMRGLEKALLDACEALPAARRAAVRNQIKAFDALFYPLPASKEYHDWKQQDVSLIDNIPFVLTYTENAYLVVPFATGDNTSVFGNVASATMINPARILYLYLVEGKKDLDALRETLPYVVEYMNKKRLRASVDLIVAGAQALIGKLGPFEKEMMALGGGRIRLVKCVRAKTVGQLPPALEAYLRERSGGKRLFAVERNRTQLSYLLLGAGLYANFPSYQFDSAAGKFRALSGCESLAYIKKRPFITVMDLMAFRCSPSDSCNQPEFSADYRDLWKKYQEKSGAWKTLCNALGAYAAEHDCIATFTHKGDEERSETPSFYHFFMPSACARGAEKILDFLKEKAFIEPDSALRLRSTAACEAVIADRNANQAEFERLFRNHAVLMQPDSISLLFSTFRREIRVLFDDLQVVDANVSGPKCNEMLELARYFAKKGYLAGLEIKPEGLLSFTYGAPHIKELLTVAGKMLEVHTYHRARELGRFDDIVSGFEIEWKGTEVKSEFDCILTKDFRTLFVECKARQDINQEFYYRIAQLRDQFGINATAVLVADTRERPEFDTAAINAIQRKRGDMLDVVTVWKPEDIADIGRTLFRIINGTYEKEEH